MCYSQQADLIGLQTPSSLSSSSSVAVLCSQRFISKWFALFFTTVLHSVPSGAVWLGVCCLHPVGASHCDGATRSSIDTVEEDKLLPGWLTFWLDILIADVVAILLLGVFSLFQWRYQTVFKILCALSFLRMLYFISYVAFGRTWDQRGSPDADGGKRDFVEGMYVHDESVSKSTVLFVCVDLNRLLCSVPGQGSPWHPASNSFCPSESPSQSLKNQSRSIWSSESLSCLIFSVSACLDVSETGGSAHNTLQLCADVPASAFARGELNAPIVYSQTLQARKGNVFDWKKKGNFSNTIPPCERRLINTMCL